MSTTRLNKKLAAAPEGAYGNLTQSFVSVGTPLPSLASAKKDSNEFKPLWQQEVLDEQGRRRLHGAFTGGFSAGYFNTVGSKEGWTPSTFKSSRDQRAGNKGQTTVDAAKAYMDAEDLDELASSRQLETSITYAAPSKPQQPTYDPLMGIFGSSTPSAAPAVPEATAALASLIEPSSSRIGAKLMRKMGWREGQGVGPRLTWEQRRKQAVELGVRLSAEEGEDEAGEASKHYFAPLDRPLKLLEAVGVREDRGWGLGYRPGPNMKQSLAESGPRREEGQAMPTMDLDEEGDDDPYANGPSIESLVGGDRRRVGVIELSEEDDDFRMSGSRGKQQRKPSSRAAPPPSTGQAFVDGTRVLPGFQILEERTNVPSQSHLPPQPPKGWEPNPSRAWTEATPAADDGTGKGRQLDAEQRGTLLGEPAPPPVPKSVFDYLSSKAKERIASLTNPSASSTATSSCAPAAPEPDAVLSIPPLDVPTALAALKGFQPFSNTSTSPDPVRQTRYTLYLQLQANLIDSRGSTLPFGPRTLPNGHLQTISELNRELHEYAQSAKVFKPVSGMLAGRFTSGGAGALGPKVEPGLYQPPAKDTSAPSSFISAGEGIEPQLVEKLTPAQVAARAGLFGDATREITVFRPARLICKRFGVRDPHEGVEEGDFEVGGAWKEASRTGYGSGGPAGATKEALGQASMDALMQSAGFRKFQPSEEQPMDDNDPPMEDFDSATPLPPPSKKADKPTLESVGLGDDEKQGEEILTQHKAPKDIFSAIFADSDDDDEDDDDDEQPTTTEAAPAVASAILASADQAPAPATEPQPAEVVLDTSTIADYKPSFVPSASRSTTTTDKSKDKDKKKKKRKAATLSFDVDEGEEGSAPTVVKKKRSGGVKREKAANEEEEWGEAPSTVHPEILKAQSAAAASSAMSTAPKDDASAAGGGRSRASDLF